MAGACDDLRRLSHNRRVDCHAVQRDALQSVFSIEGYGTGDAIATITRVTARGQARFIHMRVRQRQCHLCVANADD